MTPQAVWCNVPSRGTIRAIILKDIELVKVREGIGGTFRLSFTDEAEKTFAKKVLEKAGFEVSV